MRYVLANPWGRALGIFVGVVILVLVGSAVTLAVGLYVATTERVETEAWIAIGTGVYAFFAFAAFVVLFVTFIVLAAAAWYAWEQVKTVQLRMRLDAIDRLSSQWDSRLIRQGRKLANKSENPKHLFAALEVYDLQNSEELYVLSALFNLMEEIGLLVKDPLSPLHLGDVEDRFRPSIVHYGYLFSEYIERGREQNEDHLVNFRRIAAAMAFASMNRRSA